MQSVQNNNKQTPKNPNRLSSFVQVSLAVFILIIRYAVYLLSQQLDSILEKQCLCRAGLLESTAKVLYVSICSAFIKLQAMQMISKQCVQITLFILSKQICVWLLKWIEVVLLQVAGSVVNTDDCSSWREMKGFVIKNSDRGKLSRQDCMWKRGKLSVALSLYWAAFQGDVCVTAALIKGIFKAYIPHKLGRHYQY